MRLTPRCLVYALLFAAVCPSLLADTITVTNTSDGGAPGPAGSLRRVVTDANPGDTIVFDASLAGQTITLTNGEILILKSLTIDGGTNRVTLSGGNASRIFIVASPFTVVLNALTIRNGNDGGGGGGGLVNGGTLTMNDCTVTSCVASAAGAGILNAGTLVMNRCTVDGNVSTSGPAGGIDNVGATAHLTMTNCTVSGNVAAGGNGGGIVNAGAGATATLKYCTVAYNASSGIGGGVHADEGDANGVTVEASILAGNQATLSPDCSGTLASNGSNVLTSVSGCTLTGTTQSNLVADPKLGSLQRNGGPTKTHALQPGSPAMDFVQAGSCGIDLTDGRGLVRPQDGERNGSSVCDAGAYEAVKPIVVTSLADTGDGTTCTLRQAIAAANTNSPSGACPEGFIDATLPDRITFGVNGKITLTTGPLAPNQSVMIDGPGADKLQIGGGGVWYVLTFLDGTAASSYILSGVAIVEGKVSTGKAAGATYVGSDDTLAFDRCTFTAEFANAFLAEPACLLVNSARSVEISRTTCTETTARPSMFLLNSPFEMVDSTISASGQGSIQLTQVGRPTTLSLVNCTFRHTGGTNWLSLLSSVATYRGTIFGGASSTVQGGTGTGTSLGYNIAVEAAPSLNAPGDLPGTDPKLGSLGYHGGGVPTVNLLPDSPARNHIPAAATRRTVDQRGFLRPLGLSDVGAVERIVGGDVNGDGAVNVSDVLYLINFLFAGGPVPVGESDVNGDGTVSVADILYLINRLFAGGPAPI